MANQVCVLLVFAVIGWTTGYICSEQDGEADAFEMHGCDCGTRRSAGVLDLFTVYGQAFADCHENDDSIRDMYVIDCSNKRNKNERDIIATDYSRTVLSELPVYPNGSSVYSNITCLLLSGNDITHISYEQMRQFPKLRRLYVDYNKLAVIEQNAFTDNHELITISIANNDLSELPSVSSSNSLEDFYAEGNKLSTADRSIFGNIARLKKINLSRNKISLMPNLTDFVLLESLDLSYNQIRKLPRDHFRRLQSVRTMDLRNNKVDKLEDFVFQDMCHLSRLDLPNNDIVVIEAKAFSGTNMNYLDLANNKFPYLPSKDIRSTLVDLSVRGVRTLTEFPPAYEDGEITFPLLKTLTMEYPTHCCWYDMYFVHEASFGNVIDFGRKRRQLFDCPLKPSNFTRTSKPIKCSPEPDAFHPCHDIIQFTGLRVTIWLIIIFSICGNVLVMTVLTYFNLKKGFTVPQILITNLAVSDLFLGIYLLFIAGADLYTAGEYENKAFEWERSAACKTAGFFAVVSSVASICTLALITFERMTTIAFSYTGKRFMSIPKTVVGIVAVWVIAFVFGILPAVGVSNYGKVCICLPFEANTSLDKGYIVSLLIFTGIVCFFILICYVILFVRVKKTSSSLSGKQECRIAFKMSALVVTDFMIWAPIAIIGLVGVFRGESLVGVQESKYLMIFIFPINSWVNPLLYSILQTTFRNQLCDIVAQFGLCRDYHQRRKLKSQGHTNVVPTATTLRSRIGSITSTSTFTSFLSLFNKRSSVASIGSNEANHMQIYGKSKSKSLTHSSTSSEQPSLKEGSLRFLTPIHEAISPTQEEMEEIESMHDAVFYSEASQITSNSTTPLDPQPKDTRLLFSNDSDSGLVTQSNQDSSNTPSQSSLPDTAGQPREQTECTTNL